MRALLLILALATVAACSEPSAEQAASPAQEDRSYEYKGDRRMEAAVLDARRTLPEFSRMLEELGEEGNAMLKVGFKAQAGVEHMWLNNIVIKDGKTTGVLINQPEHNDMQMGKVYEIDPALVSDWSIVKGGKVWGNYTTRVMLDDMSPEDAAFYRANLSATPTER